ncbi:MAG: hypothetical protein J0L61_05410 [Planctomycetes bacterium]|nr:hypothetical protein [Planctomycetota bacterium]
MSNATQPSRREYLYGLITGAAVSVAAFSMMGQGYSKPNEDKRPATPATGASSPAVVERDEFYVTPGNDANSTARLWRKPAGRNSLEFLGEFQPTKTSR